MDNEKPRARAGASDAAKAKRDLIYLVDFGIITPSTALSPVT